MGLVSGEGTGPANPGDRHGIAGPCGAAGAAPPERDRAAIVYPGKLKATRVGAHYLELGRAEFAACSPTKNWVLGQQDSLIIIYLIKKQKVRGHQFSARPQNRSMASQNSSRGGHGPNT